MGWVGVCVLGRLVVVIVIEMEHSWENKVAFENDQWYLSSALCTYWRYNNPIGKRIEKID